MKIRILVSIGLGILLATTSVKAQTDTATVSQRALHLADQMLKAYTYSNWDQYVSLSYPGVVKYYGGKTSYLKHLHRSHYTTSLNGNPAQVRIIQLSNDKNEWQCVMEKSFVVYSDGKRLRENSYLVGQSQNDGRDWTFFEVADNAVDKINYIMPDIFATLTIPVKHRFVEEGIVRGK